MTTLTMNKSFSIIQAVLNSFSGISKALIMARGTEANYKIAHHLRHEYPNDSVQQIAHNLNARLRKEVYGD